MYTLSTVCLNHMIGENELYNLYQNNNDGVENLRSLQKLDGYLTEEKKG